MASCVKCDTSISFLKSLFGFDLCSNCRSKVNNILQQLDQEMIQAAEQQGITEHFQAYVHQVLGNHNIPDSYSVGLLEELDYLKNLTDIRKGQLPTVQVNAILDPDEIGYLETPAIYYKPNQQVRYIEGRYIATNKRLYFITPDRDSMKVDWNNVVNVDECTGKTPKGKPTTLVRIQVTRGKGGGLYYLSDPTLVVAITTTAVRLWKRHLVELKENPNTQGIPDHVKAQVFHRDGGRCMQCGYIGPYIEYDHIHPRSKGGLNTVENIQLLCGQCNRRKGSRI